MCTQCSLPGAERKCSPSPSLTVHGGGVQGGILALAIGLSVGIYFLLQHEQDSNTKRSFWYVVHTNQRVAILGCHLSFTRFVETRGDTGDSVWSEWWNDPCLLTFAPSPFHFFFCCTMWHDCTGNRQSWWHNDCNPTSLLPCNSLVDWQVPCPSSGAVPCREVRWMILCTIPMPRCPPL